MILNIDPSNGVAIYEQVVRQVKFAVASGKLRRGELVPSVRELAKQLAINPNTVSRAYRQLQDEEVLESVRGMGMQIVAGADRRCRSDRKKLIAARLEAVLLEARQSGLNRSEVEKIVDRKLATFPETGDENE